MNQIPMTKVSIMMKSGRSIETMVDSNYADTVDSMIKLLDRLTDKRKFISFHGIIFPISELEFIVIKID